VVKLQTTSGINLNLLLSGYQTWEFSDLDPNTGVRTINIPASGSHYNPINLLGLAKVCVRPGGNGTGKLDCDGGEPDYHSNAEQDHDTSQPPGPNGGLPIDPECDDVFVNPGGLVSQAQPSTQFPPACISPIQVTLSGTYAAGGMTLTESLLLRILTNVNDPCPADSDPFDPNAGDLSLTGLVTTGNVAATVYDAVNSSGTALTQTNLSTSATNVPFGCTNIENGVLNTGRLGFALPFAELVLPGFPTMDAVGTVHIACQ
jgi:hypothetical protein